MSNTYQITKGGLFDKPPFDYLVRETTKKLVSIILL
jgi:hypothetical protein